MNDARLDDHATPEEVGPYRIVDRLGAGGMGVVYRARDERLERWVAIKHIRPGEADNRSRERLRREARTVAGLSHPSIVQVHDIVTTLEGDWIVMELVEGRTLKEQVDQQALSMSQVLRLAREIAEGLAEAHAKGIVHRDLKTENVKVTELGHAKILDFGLAKNVSYGSQQESISVPGAILGTGRAMSPEQALGEEVNHLSDLFSFGTLLFETVTRRPPFVGSSLILTMAQICTEEQSSARDLNSGVPRQLSDLIDHLLEKDPLQRPQSAGEVVEVLQRIEARLASKAIRAGSSGSEPSDTAVALAVPPEPPQAMPAMPAVARLSSRTSGVRPLTMTRSSESTAGIFIKTLVETSIASGTDLGNRFGDADTYELCSRHDRLARDVLAEHDGLEIHHSEEGFLFLFERPVDAVEFVLAYRHRLEGFNSESGARLEARAAIHLSEIFLRENTPEEIHRGAKPFEVEGLAKLIVSRVGTLARGGQTLLTQEAYDMTRRALVGHPLAERKLHWRSHGPFLFRGVDEPVNVFQVSTESIPARQTLSEVADARRLDQDVSGPIFRRPRGRRSLLALAALVPLMVLGAVARYRLTEPSSRTVPEPSAKVEIEARQNVRPTLAVLGFRNATGNTEDSWLSTALAELLSTELGAGEDLRLIAGESVARLKEGKEDLLSVDALAADTLRTIHAEFGSDYVILGSYFLLGPEKKLVVQLKLQDTHLGETIDSLRESGVETELLDLVSRIGHRVRGKLDLAAVPSRKAEALRATLSSSNEANRLFFRGKERFWDFDVLKARDDFLEATQLDPDFAMAHAALSRAWLTLGYDANAAESGRRAYALAEGLPREDLLTIESTYHESSGDLDGAIRAQQALWQFYPDKIEYGLRLAGLQIVKGSHVDAMATVEELRGLPEPSSDDPRIDLAEAEAANGLWRSEQVVDRATRAIEKGRPRQNSSLVAKALRLRGRSYVHLRREDEAKVDLEEARALFEDVGDDLGLGKTLISLAYLELGRRNVSHAEELLREALAIFLHTGSRMSIHHAQHGLAFMIQRQGRLKAARRLLEESLQVARDLTSRELEIWTLDSLASVLYQMGELVRAEKMIQNLIEISGEHGDRRSETWARVNLGLVKQSAGKLEEAWKIFDELYRKAEDTNDRDLGSQALSGLGAIHFARGELEAAEKSFARYMRIQSAANDWGEQASNEPVYAATLLALRKPEEAFEVASRIADRFGEAETPLYRAVALGLAAEALWQQDLPREARKKLAEAIEVAGECESPDVRLRLELSSARFLAATRPGEASRKLRPLISEATRLILKSVELDARLALGEIELASASQADAEVGRSRLEALAEEAARLGYGLVARKAAANLDSAAAVRPEARSTP